MTCAHTHKKRFASEQEALDELARIIRRSMIGERRTVKALPESAVFECPYCAGWHLTSQPAFANEISHRRDVP